MASTTKYDTQKEKERNNTLCSRIESSLEEEAVEINDKLNELSAEVGFDTAFIDLLPRDSNDNALSLVKLGGYTRLVRVQSKFFSVDFLAQKLR